MGTRLTKQRVRIRFGKTGALRFIGHLDLAKLWERVLRRAQLPLEYTQGFNRRPRMQFANALPLGLTSDAELLDVWMVEVLGLDGALIKQIHQVSPADLQIYEITEVEITSPSLPTLTRQAVYRLNPIPAYQFPEDMLDRIERVLSAKDIIRERRKKNYDLRPLIKSLELVDDTTCKAILALEEGKTGRPDELIEELGLERGALRIHREAIILIDDLKPEDAAAQDLER